jgi:OmpA-OmpF porin, OOP family
MNRRKWTSRIAWALAWLASSPATAADPGFYVTAALGRGGEDPTSNGTNISNFQGIVHVEPDRVAVDDGSLAWSVGLGYRINRYLAGEVEYVDFGTADIREHYDLGSSAPFPFPTELDLQFSSKVTGPVLSVLGTLPVGDRFEVFLRGGALFASREYSVGGNLSFGQQEKLASTVWLAGAGVTWSFAPRWGVRAEYQQSGELDDSLISGETKVDRLTVSALFRF